MAITMTTPPVAGSVAWHTGVNTSLNDLATNGAPSASPTFTGTVNSGSTLSTGVINVTNTTQSTSKDTGCLILEGGMGMEKDLFTAGTLNIINTDANAIYDTAINIKMTNTQGAVGNKGTALKFYNDSRGNNMSAIIACGLTSSSVSGSTGFISFGTKTADADALPTERLKIVADGTVEVKSKITVPTSTPASAGATGVAGTITWDASYIYICTATNTWKRVAIATW